MSSNPKKVHMLREWVMRYYGDGRQVRCTGCGVLLERGGLTLDHYPIPAFMGGTYRRDNVRPMCAPCNHSNTYTPSREWVEAFAAAHGITLRKGGCPQYGREWYREHRSKRGAPLRPTLAFVIDAGVSQ